MKRNLTASVYSESYERMTAMAGNNAAARDTNSYHRCARFRDCHLEECMFYEGADDCWSLVSPFKLRRRPSLLLKDTAEHCECLAKPCTECEYYAG